MSELRQSPERLNVLAIASTAIIATMVFAIAVAVAWWMTPDERRVRRPMVEPSGTIAGVERGLLEDPPRGLVERTRTAARLHRYGWSDRRRGLAHVPIARAIDMAALGCRPPGAGEPALEPTAPSSCPEPEGAQ